MSIPIVTAEEAEEYDRLYTEYAAAVVRADAVRKAHGIDSAEFKKADALASDLWVRLRDLQGRAGKHG